MSDKFTIKKITPLANAESKHVQPDAAAPDSNCETHDWHDTHPHVHLHAHRHTHDGCQPSEHEHSVTHTHSHSHSHQHAPHHGSAQADHHGFIHNDSQHGHNHAHLHGHHHVTTNDPRLLARAFWLNFCFALIELVGGWWTNSVAILADAMHDLGDSLAIAFAWLAAVVAGRAATTLYSYGYKRWSLLSAFINCCILISGSLFILWHAIPRLWAPELPHAPGMMLLAVLGIAVNGAAVWQLRGGHSQNAQVISWHLLEDILGWAAVLIGSILIYFTGWAVIDPLLSIAVTLFILLNVWRQFTQTLRLFLQVTPDPALQQRIELQLRQLPFVHDLHHLHLWSLDGAEHVLTVHLTMAEQAQWQYTSNYKQQIRDRLAEFQLAHTTVELEWPNELCRDSANL
jgi:cobalt-zinc-cadmium efflux system protein